MAKQLFQCAAIIISVTAITSHFVVLFLARGSGLPFGLLGAGFQTGNFGFFFRRAFWSAMPRVYHKRSFTIIAFAIFLIISFVLAFLVGPSSAIVMRPDLNSWLMLYGPYEVYFPTNQSEFWPETLSASTPDICSDFLYTTTESRCPSGGFSELERWSSWGLHSGPELTSGNLGLWNAIPTLNLPGHSVSQPKLLSQALTSILQPFVQVKCNIFDYNSVAKGVTFPLTSSLTGHSSAMYGDVNTITMSVLDFNNFEEDNNIHMSWVNLHDFNNPASIGAILKLPNNENSIRHNYVVPCAVDARWISAELSMEPATSQSVFGNFGELRGFLWFGGFYFRRQWKSISRLGFCRG
ncbi:hypothetical protein BPOR_1126g00020 [Botrytis porri]|uniref:Uncharacterized protein n=1 Tax=Botrytis porri TaxID=87229 RepID=A0A4Z1K6D3_9HELO|nr:hypothetical protein BPOR_1126g00020 [Botrytis porri]